MKKQNPSPLTVSVHAGSHGDPQFLGLSTPIYPASAYDYEGPSGTLYPRYFNTPNHQAVAEKVAALEHGEKGLVFSSGMASILTSLLALLQKGDHAIFQSDLYGGTHHAVLTEFPRYGIGYSLVDASDPSRFEKAIRPETKLIFVETPSNPTLKITDLKAVAAIAKKHGLITLIDNTFASPVNQNPIDLGIDLVLHSGTKYIGGHSDLCCGVAVGSSALIQKVKDSALHFGASPDAHLCWLIERSLKTMVLRVRQQNANALEVAQALASDPRIGKVYYPGLPSHPSHDIAREQMPGGFGGMLSFEVKGDPDAFLSKLKLVRRAVSLGGVESTITSPVKTSHSKMSEADRLAIGVTNKLLRLSVGIEEGKDIVEDLMQAL